MNINEIAKLSGVSRATVSRVLNGQSGVRPQTRERVLSIVNDINGKSEKLHAAAPFNSHIGTSVSGHKTTTRHVFSLVIQHSFPRLFADSSYAYLLQGIQQSAVQRGFEMYFWFADSPMRQLYDRLVRHEVDGILILDASHDSNELARKLVEARFPCVVIGRPGIEGASYVDVDNQQAARQAVEHLIRLGYKRIATITGPQRLISARDRLVGYEEALRNARYPIDPLLIADGNYTEEGGHRAAGLVLSSRPDAIFVASDTMSVGVLRRLQAAQLRVPADIALISYNDLPLAELSEPALTTVRQPLETIGRVAASLLLDIIEQRDLSPRRIVLPTQLVTRASCRDLRVEQWPDQSQLLS